MTDKNDDDKMNHHTESVMIFNDAKRMGVDIFILDMSTFQGSIEEFIEHRDNLEIEEIKGQIFIPFKHLKHVSKSLEYAIGDLEQYRTKDIND